MKAAKAEIRDIHFKVWCHHCSIRIAPNEERVAVREKTYHAHCYSKLGPIYSKPKIDPLR
jgi:hypothetical protein